MPQGTDPPTPGGPPLDGQVSVLRRMAVGSAWMVAARWSVRAIGLVSTVILARVLGPDDFGLVAMGMIAVEFVRILSEPGQDLAVIRTANATSEHFDTAWTMSVCSGLVIALALQGIAPLAGWYFDEPRVTAVIRVLALAPLFESLTNIGVVVGFRRDLNFAKDFQYVLVRKLSGFIIGVPLAVVLQSYWALVIAIVCSGLITALLSYSMHPYRPRFRLPRLREIWLFSVWMQAGEVAAFFRNQTDRIVVANVAGTASLGTYYVADDVSTAPTSEIVTPTARALFPVYATLLSDPAQLARAYLDVLSFVVVIAVSTSVGMALVARDIVVIVLGQKWLIVAPLVPWLAMSAGVLALELTVNPVLGVTGNARMHALRNTAFVLLLAPTAIIFGRYFGIDGVAAARLAVALIFVPILFYSVMQVIPVTAGQILERVWRPLVAAAAMAAAFRIFDDVEITFAVGRLMCEVVFGAAIFVVSLLTLWLIAGRPSGAEEMCLVQSTRVFRRLSSRLV